jgi:dihydroorotase
MAVPLWLHRVDLLVGPAEHHQRIDVLLDQRGQLEAWGAGVAGRASALGLQPTAAEGWLLAPTLVDPHSVLERPWSATQENLHSLAAAAAAGGYGTVALLPWASPWRDRTERLQGLHWPEPLRLRAWGSFSRDGADQDLAPHRDQIEAGAVGLACGDALPPLALLERGLLLAEMAERPVLVAPRHAALTAAGFVREGVEALRAGWPLDPLASETLPLQTLLALAAAQATRRLVLMNLSTAAAVGALEAHPSPPAATVSWWHLLADAANLPPTAEGWRVVPSLGGPADRQALIGAVRAGLITAVSVHHLALDPEEQWLPLDQRRAGLAGHGAPHGLVLPCLWQELVVRQGWNPAELWQALCWGPAALLGEQPERLEVGSRRWLLFDPAAAAAWDPASSLSRAANQPLRGQVIRGQIRACGLTEPQHWCLGGAGCPSG